MNNNQLLNDCLNALNELPNTLLSSTECKDTYMLARELNKFLKTESFSNDSNVYEKQRFIDFLIKRIFESNGYKSSTELFDAVKHASSIEEWRPSKSAFNDISVIAPMRNDTIYLVGYKDTVKLIQDESEAWVNYVNGEKS